MNPIEYLKESRDELKKVRWPTRATTLQLSLIVIVSVAIATSLFGVIDYGLSELFKVLLERSL
ncbi:preprotein translocase subunit SecE [Candidatus Berkelbacteria bacterium]|nr:preprotein translocase subunit SecE [Candidatus Berkelbacteria bacterium]